MDDSGGSVKGDPKGTLAVKDFVPDPSRPAWERNEIKMFL